MERVRSLEVRRKDGDLLKQVSAAVPRRFLMVHDSSVPALRESWPDLRCGLQGEGDPFSAGHYGNLSESVKPDGNFDMRHDPTLMTLWSRALEENTTIASHLADEVPRPAF